MDVNILTELVNNLGFPICMVAYFIWDKKNAMKTMADAINNNTKVLTKLLGVLDHEEMIDEGMSV